MNLIKAVKALLLVGAAAAVGAVSYTAAAPPAGIPILEYHKINDIDTDVCAIPTREFREQLQYLQEQGYQTISLLEFIKAKKGKGELPPKPIVLTFDDGYEDNYTELLPIIEPYGMKATVFMATNYIGKDGYLSWDQLRDMQSRNIEIASHTANHLPLSELAPEQAEDELKLSKLLLEWNGIHTVFFFSYPNGIYNETALQQLPANNYLGAVTGDSGLNTFDTDPFLLQRVNIPRLRFGLAEFKLRLFKAELFTKLGLGQHNK